MYEKTTLNLKLQEEAISVTEALACTRRNTVHEVTVGWVLLGRS